MIKEDIVYGNSHSEQNQPNLAQESNSVDDIFAAADLEMEAQNRASIVQFKEKKKRKHVLRNLIIGVAFCIVSFIVVVVVLGLRALNESYEPMKQDFLLQIREAQIDLLEINDDELSVDQYYQKKLLLLFSADDIEAVIKDIEDIRNFSQILEADDDVDIGLIPEEKRDEYQKIMSEYKEALQNQENSQLTTDTNTTKKENLNDMPPSE